MQTSIKVSGMTCKNCEQAVKEALLEVSGVTNVSVNLDDGMVMIKHAEDVDSAKFTEVVEDQGYDVA